MPLDAWFRGELRDFVRDTLLAPSATLGRYVHVDRVRVLIDDHLGGRTNDGQRLWSLMCFERWLQLLPSWTRVYGRRPVTERLAALPAFLVRCRWPFR